MDILSRYSVHLSGAGLLAPDERSGHLACSDTQFITNDFQLSSVFGKRAAPEEFVLLLQDSGG